MAFFNKLIDVRMPDRVSEPRNMLLPLSWMWRVGNAIDLALKMRRRRTLKTPVVSVGALTMGGAGKSPMVAHLAARLREMGRNPAILTRGYRRVSREPVVIVRRGQQAPVESTGDEAQMFVRAGAAHVGIGADRYQVGRRMEEEIAPEIFLLDDGFQHVQLDRAHDVVLIDANDPLAGGVFPAGRLREPPTALRRATEIVITRIEPGDDIVAIEQLLRRYNPLAPIYQSRVVPLEWIDAATGDSRDLQSLKRERVGAFCGLGDPRAFWRTLDGLNLNVAMRRAFYDHHRYTTDDFRRLDKEADSLGVDVLVTTEKDAMNLGTRAAPLAANVKLYWLKIGIEIHRGDDLLRRLTQSRSVTPLERAGP
jgi:tetraacyldisaccharide 4'-kinase